MDEIDLKRMSETTAQSLLDAFEGANESLNEFEKSWEKTYGVLVNEVKLKCAERMIFYVEKYSNATFLTRWYWLRKLKKFVKGIDVLKDL